MRRTASAARVSRLSVYCDDGVMKQLSYDKNIMFERKKKQQQKNLGEICYINLGYYKV